ncbi:conserved hypothetical protein [Theileria equi strain WA]|uniref:RAP domain-containing protein n=1 Tax=Theileria equi strain WA TaxID=1537102 RepID=L1LBH9_THEEQ|nr:conserved hypothetical protein [Theileria equi strain WA]EKX72630.1 conserved hypothetical protein [Theileria equi strain WA]|eukprot:XP_004832082.1 conserved hypothetical protein [Theileria equi strain WA]
MRLLRIYGQHLRDLGLCKELNGSSSNISSLSPSKPTRSPTLSNRRHYGDINRSASTKLNGDDRPKRLPLALANKRETNTKEKGLGDKHGVSISPFSDSPGRLPGTIDANKFVNPLNATPIANMKFLYLESCKDLPMLIPKEQLFVLKDEKCEFDDSLIDSLKVSGKQTLANTRLYEVPNILKGICMKKVPVEIGVFLGLAESYLKLLPGRNVKELIDSFIIFSTYSDSNLKIVNYMLQVVGTHLERKLQAFISLGPTEIIRSLAHLISARSGTNIEFSLPDNKQVLSVITSDVSNLSDDSRGLLFFILASSDSYPHSNTKYEPICRELSHFISNHRKFSYDTLRMLVSISHKFCDDSTLVSGIFTSFMEYKNRNITNILTDALLKFKTKVFENYPAIITKIMDGFKNVSPELVTSLYCHHLKHNLSLDQDRKYEDFIKANWENFNLSDISNIVRHLSVYGQHKNDICSYLYDRFLQLQQYNGLSDEVFDCMLSFSFVGFIKHHFRHIDPLKAVYLTSKNNLNYLAYLFLLSNIKNPQLWDILLFRVAHECTPCANLYEIFQSAILLEYIPKDIQGPTGNKFMKIFKQSKHQYMREQFYKANDSDIPYRRIFNYLGLSYKRDHGVLDLYKFPYFLDHYGILIDTKKCNSEATGYLMGEYKLKMMILRKFGYKLVSSTSKEWNMFRDSGMYHDIRGMAEFMLSMDQFREVRKGLPYRNRNAPILSNVNRVVTNSFAYKRNARAQASVVPPMGYNPHLEHSGKIKPPRYRGKTLQIKSQKYLPPPKVNAKLRTDVNGPFNPIEPRKPVDVLQEPRKKVSLEGRFMVLGKDAT